MLGISIAVKCDGSDQGGDWGAMETRVWVFVVSDHWARIQESGIKGGGEGHREGKNSDGHWIYP